ncbi:uncharacterized protein [Panulirus ornatus]|uniref:uncharacterized protein isoform X2 n=1 Tax=Panulirus ornatus TaxID=150431 RepID=UPI003A8AFF20
MKVGDLCRCITNFSGVLPDEITVYKNDIVQVQMVVDRHWLEVEGGGSVGRVPSSVLVKIDMPPHPSHLPLFVASAEFLPSQPGDLGLARGDFVIGLNPVDESWWCGEINGNKGIFPLNFVWSINKDIIQVEDKGEKPISLKGRVKMSLRAQLPEELDLYAGDIVNITHAVDKDWYRGESNGATGIFPSNFVDIVEETLVPSSSPLCPDRSNLAALSSTAVSSSQAANFCLNSDYVVQEATHTVVSPYLSLEASVPSVGHTAPASDYSTFSANIAPTASTSQLVGQTSTCPVNLSNTSSHWKTVESIDDADLFDDDYFKQNMPGIFSSSVGSGNASASNANDACVIPPSFSQSSPSLPSAEAGFKYENILEASVFPEKSCHDAYASGIPQLSSVESGNLKDRESRYENISQDNPVYTNAGYDLTVMDDVGVDEYSSESSAFSVVPESSCDNMINSLSQKVDEYFSKNLLEERDEKEGLSIDSDSLIKEVSTLSSIGYNEDNTGIEPYGRAVFSFRAQYSNELTFKKGDIIHLLKHVDSHWTLGHVGDSTGIFPTSYVDIIVDCLHNEEELFLSRSELPVTYLGHAKAAYDFQAQENGDVSMVKGDIIKIIKFVDDNWVIVENMTGSKGMCPKNYLSNLAGEASSYTNKLTTQISNNGPDASAERESRLPVQSTVHDRSRSSSPFSTPGNRRSYNKDDFGSIKKQEVEIVLAKNVASLDVTLRCGQGQSDKKVGGSVFTKREEYPVVDDQSVAGKVLVSPPVIPARIKRMSHVDNGETTESEDSRNSHVAVTQPHTVLASSSTSNTPKTTPSSAVPTTLTVTEVSNSLPADSRSVLSPVAHPRKRIVKSESSETITCSTSTVKAHISSASSEAVNVTTLDMKSNVKDIDTDTKVTKSSRHLQQPSGPSLHSDAYEPVYAQVQKPRSAVKPSLTEFQKQRVEENTPPEVKETRCDSAAFPDDVSHLSVCRKSTNSSEGSIGSSSPALAPQRPAPPPPPKVCDAYYDEVEEYYSLPAKDSEMTSVQNLMPSQRSSRTDLVESGNDVGAVNDINSVAAEEAQSAQNEQVAREEDMGLVRSNQRLELVQEIVTTEHEYIHDLEALIQVIQQAPSQKESQSVDLSTLMGNISQVVEVAKKILKLLDRVAYETDEELLVGCIFLLCADEICEVYKIYCSNHNVAAEPLLKKYAEEPEPAAFLQWVLSELQQHKIQLMDMRSVLIKPVQRVLKYPLFLDRLVSETPRSHPDYKDLTEAKTRMANVAKEINEYTKRLDLVNKYRFETDQSLQSKMQRVTLHSVAKKSARISTLVSEMLGIMNQTKDPEFDEEVAKFRSMQKAAAALAQNIDAVVQGIRARHKAELEMARGVVATLLQAARTPEIEAIQKAASDSCNKLFKVFDSFMKQRIILPTKQLLCLCEVPERLIQKRHDKMLDYDNAQYKLDKTRDPTRTRILEEELSLAKGTYEALNTQLMMELPVLTKCGTEVVMLATKSLVASRMYLQGHLAQLYLHLAQIPGLSFSGGEDMLAQFRVKYLQQIGEFRHLSFIPVDSLQKSLPRPKSWGRKSLENTTVKKDTSESVKKKVLHSYPAEVIYVVTEVHTPAEVMELTLYPGDHVALLKNKDPLGRSDRWFIDDGDNKGFARAASLRPLQGQENRGVPITAVTSSASNTVAPLSQPVPVAAPRPSTLPRAAPAPPLPERPPRYEDLFPASTSGVPGYPSQVASYRTAEQQVPPPRYSLGQVSQVPISQAPLPSKVSHIEQPPTINQHSQVSESDYYSPPLDRQQSNEYNSPVTEDDNIYEEIDQGSVDIEDEVEVEGAESSPIYEVIQDGHLLEDPGQHDTKELSVTVASESAEPQFYYALYNFGGSDATQLNLVAGQVVMVLHASSSEWWFVEDRHGNQGYVPASYLTKYI